MRSVLAPLLNRAPVPYKTDVSLFRPVPSSTADTYLGAMAGQGTIFGIVNKIAESMSAQTWRLYRKRTGSEVTRHPALEVFAKPNPHYTQTEFVETLQQHFELTGEMWTILTRQGNLPTELWPVRPDRMRPIPSRTEFISGYAYKQGKDEIPFGLDEIIYNKRPSPLDPYRGISPVGSLLVDIEGEKAASQWNTMFFRNGAEPGGIIQTNERLSDKDWEEMVERWNSQHKGVGKAHRVAVIEEATWQDRRYSMRDMQFEQLRRFNREAFRQAYGFPKPLLGDVEDVNRANAEAAGWQFSKWLLVPRLNRWRTMLNDDFLPRFGSLGRNVYFDYDDPVPPNQIELGQNERLRALNVKAFTDAGYDPAQTLETFGFPPIDHVGPPDTMSDIPDEEGPGV